MNGQLCIMIHGFTGNPSEVEPLSHALEQRAYDVIAPLLPGHHQEKIRMKRATATEWVDSVQEIIQNSVCEYSQIHLIGFSMGAMIASILASRFPISTLTLLSPAVFVATPKVFLTRVKIFSSRATTDRPMWGQAMLRNVASMNAAPLTNVWQFRKLVSQAKKVFPSLNLPVCIIHSHQDEIVDPRSADWIYRVIPSNDKEIHYLNQSSHLICLDCEAETVKQTVLDFLDHHVQNNGRFTTESIHPYR